MSAPNSLLTLMGGFADKDPASPPPPRRRSFLDFIRSRRPTQVEEPNRLRPKFLERETAEDAAEMARKKAREEELRRKGRASTIITGGQGVTADAPLSRPMALGA